MKTRIRVVLIAGLVAGCSSPAPDTSAARADNARGMIEQSVDTTSDGTSTATSLEAYKTDLAHRISAVNSTKVYTSRPQALLRSVVVLKYSIGAGGDLMRSEIVRSNRDRVNEATAMASLKSTAPFPKPARHLLRAGRVDVTETWLFNNDGRFQIRTIALPQMEE